MGLDRQDLPIESFLSAIPAYRILPVETNRRRGNLRDGSGKPGKLRSRTGLGSQGECEMNRGMWIGALLVLAMGGAAGPVLAQQIVYRVGDYTPGAQPPPLVGSPAPVLAPVPEQQSPAPAYQPPAVQLLPAVHPAELPTSGSGWSSAPPSQPAVDPWGQASGVRSQESEVRSQRSGVRNQESVQPPPIAPAAVLKPVNYQQTEEQAPPAMNTGSLPPERGPVYTLPSLGEQAPVSAPPQPSPNALPQRNLAVPNQQGSQFAVDRVEPPLADPPSTPGLMPRIATSSDGVVGQSSAAVVQQAYVPPTLTVIERIQVQPTDARIERLPDFQIETPKDHSADVTPDLEQDQTPWADPIRTQFYVKGEYLLWWTKADHVPVLATTGPPTINTTSTTVGGVTTTTTSLVGGLPGQPGTRVLFGGGDLDHPVQSGMRLTAGCWLDMWDDDALEVSAFWLPQQAKQFHASSDQTPVIARPFIDETTGTQQAQFTAFPGLFIGRYDLNAPTDLWGIDANLRCRICCDHTCWGSYRIDLIAGARYIDLEESLSIEENVQFLSNPLLPAYERGRTDQVVDRFGTRNQFAGGQVGVTGEIVHGPWSVDFRAKVAIGDTVQDIDIAGSQTLPDPSGRVGGLLAESSNIGKHERDRFSVVPEIGLDLGYQVTDNIRGFVGYNFLYWTNVVRPGQQIDTVIDSNLIPNFPAPVPSPANRPAVLYKESDYWAQGLTVGLEFRY